MESKQVQLESALNDSKVQAANELNDVKVALEQSQETVKVIWNYLPRVENENYCPLTAFECMTVRMRFNRRVSLKIPKIGHQVPHLIEISTYVK